MAWSEVTRVDQRVEFVELAAAQAAVFATLCRRFGVSRKTGYKWIARARGGAQGWAGDRSRRPRHSPWRTDAATERAVIGVRAEHPAWGARKIRRRLLDLGAREVPSASTVTAILRRHGLIRPEDSRARQPLVRFEHPEPNDLWQMDFKGPVRLHRGVCHPLSVIDDHSRYALCLRALTSQRRVGVQAALTQTFRRYGLPHRLLMDNGACWGASCSSRHTALGAWLLRLGVRISHGRAYHPQTQGKAERFHRTLQAEALGRAPFLDLGDCQRALARFRHSYNHERPHEALAMRPPSSRHRVSPIAFPEMLPAIEYLPADTVRTVMASGLISFHSAMHIVGRAFAGQPVALRETVHDGRYDVFYCAERIGRIDLRRPSHIKYERRAPSGAGSPAPLPPGREL